MSSEGPGLPRGEGGRNTLFDDGIMNPLRTREDGNAPVRMVLKKKAHAFTLVCVIWCLFSIIAVLFFRDGMAGGSKDGVYIAIGIWTLHLVLIGVASWLWVTEQPKKVDVVATSADVR